MASSDPSSNLTKKEEDDLLLDAHGDIRSGQQRSPPAAAKLTPENFRIVRQQADRLRSLIHNKEKTRAFLDYNLRLQQQELRPKWMQPSPAMPLLPGSTPFPREVHEKWTSISRKFERKLHKQVINSLPSVMDSMDEKIHLERDAGLQKVKNNIQEPSQKRRAEILYLRFVNQTDRISSLSSRRQTARRQENSSM